MWTRSGRAGHWLGRLQAAALATLRAATGAAGCVADGAVPQAAIRRIAIVRATAIIMAAIAKDSLAIASMPGQLTLPKSVICSRMPGAKRDALHLSMPFSDSLAQQVNLYARSHLEGDLDWHIDQFSFLADDAALQRRVGEEFYTARYIYKILEGLHLDDQWAVPAQARLQVLQYASIYEACLHHVLFEISRNHPRVQALGKYVSLKSYDVPLAKFRSFDHDGRTIVSAYWAENRAEVSKIRFDDKTNAAVAMGVIGQSLGEDLKKIYEARNSVHIHAELKKQLEFDLDLGRLAYLRVQPFCEQLGAYVNHQLDSSAHRPESPDA